MLNPWLAEKFQPDRDHYNKICIGINKNKNKLSTRVEIFNTLNTHDKSHKFNSEQR